MPASPPTTERAGEDPHRTALVALVDAGLPFLVGGAYALQIHLGVMPREVKDLDLFLRPADVDAALAVLRQRGFEADLAFPHWLAKARVGGEFIDLIFGSGNGEVSVDDGWFEHATRASIFDVPILLCPPEEGIWSRSFVMERERYDGADVAHLLLCCADSLDWERLLERFAGHWRVLFAHLVLFGFIYPSERDRLPTWVMQRLSQRLAQDSDEDASAAAERVCRGTLLSRIQFLIDVERWGFADARVRPRGHLSPEDAERWTDAGDEVEAVRPGRPAGEFGVRQGNGAGTSGARRAEGEARKPKE